MNICGDCKHFHIITKSFGECIKEFCPFYNRKGDVEREGCKEWEEKK